MARLLKARPFNFTLAEIRAMIRADASGALGIGPRRSVDQVRLLEQRKHENEAALAELHHAYSSLYATVSSQGG